MLFSGALSVGVSIDEHYHVLDFRGWAWGADPSKSLFGAHGLSTQVLYHLGSSVLGAETLGSVAFSSEAFATRHTITGLMGLATGLAVMGIVWSITRDSFSSLWAGAAILAVPTFLGHSMFNPKDIPTALGYTLYTFSCVLVVARLREFKRSLIRDFWLISVTAFGFWLVVGTRYIFVGAMLITAIFTMTSVVFLWRHENKVFLRITKVCGPWLLGNLFGFIAVLFTNPCIIAEPVNCENAFQVFSRAFGSSSDVTFSAPTLVAGRFETPIDPAFWLLPLALVAGLPLSIIVLALFGAIFGPENLKPRPLTGSPNSLLGRGCIVVMTGLLWMQVLLVPSLVIFSREEIYDRARHHLYTYPAVAALAGIGLCLVLNARFRQKSLPWTYKWGAAVVGVLFLFIPLAEGARLWPYNYVYVNPIASLRGIEGQWETDYWAVSLREALDYVPVDQPFSVVGPFWAVKPFMADRGSSPLTARANVGEVHVIEAYRPGLGWNGLPKECRDIVKIQRNLRGHVVPIAQTGICPRSLGLGVSYLDVLAHDP